VANHWRIASGLGCDRCNCDLIGSISSSCNEFNGQCDCKQGFGGRQCDQVLPNITFFYSGALCAIKDAILH